jgi:hypothetical protein
MVLDWRGPLVELVQLCMYRRDGDEARVKDNKEGYDRSHDHVNNEETLKVCTAQKLGRRAKFLSEERNEKTPSF